MDLYSYLVVALSGDMAILYCISTFTNGDLFMSWFSLRYYNAVIYKFRHLHCYEMQLFVFLFLLFSLWNTLVKQLTVFTVTNSDKMSIVNPKRLEKPSETYCKNKQVYF